MRKTNELFVGLEYLHLVPDSRDTDQAVVTGTHRTEINIDAVLVLRLIVVAFYRARLTDSGAGRDKQILVIVASLFEEDSLFILLGLEVIAHFTLFIQYVIE